MIPINPSPPLAGFPPVFDRQTAILILGSFPGIASLQVQQYYAHPRNQFWRLVSALIGQDLSAAGYEEKLAVLRAHRIGLWDALAACAREGSLDSAIRAAQVNDFGNLKHHCPQLRTIAFNGKASGNYAPLFTAAGFTTIVLPSSSPAHAAMSFEQKLAAWRGIMP